ncbi:MAG: hypothetical protein U0939_00410 [Pirellulales bacterium]
MALTWSQRVAQRYQVRLPPDVTRWLDEERWRLPGGGEFNQALTPEQILDPEPGLIWPGFMLPDTLPLIGNQYGDWLCLRVAADSGAEEFVYWSHAGGDWLPSGGTLAESLLYDALRGLETGGRTPGGNWSDTAIATQDGWQTHVAWAWEQLAADAPTLERSLRPSPAELRGELARRGWARWALARDAVVAKLDCPLRSKSDYRTAQRIGVPWEPDYVRWMFDTELIPPERRRQLLEHFGACDQELLRQDWREAERLATAVADARADMGWSFDVAGWAAERRGDVATAIARYAAGIRPSLFADHTVTFRTHWIADGFAKFSAARLYDLRAETPQSVSGDPYVRLYWEQEPTTLRERVCAYWLQAARVAEQQGEWSAAYDSYYRAGWDLGLDSLAGYAEILEGLERTALQQGAAGRAAVAALHRGLLPD